MNKIVLSVKEVCELLGLSSTTVYTMVSTGQLPHFRARNRILFNRQLIEEFTRGELTEVQETKILK